ncbi:hypothetical protein BTHE68_71860 (plasmid) [Burkholderia sp. THE68]|uniref:hypothetical protein n=1 Tax=Burkholderia sp. THE68 TaxID=758782 RepID=UPI001317668B|nr:hypothetical protein [Burkholderia sp. THE68]BBU33452.1 hypothetical protein BTHE68_71860 [Burkholderia sp. THE68]
MTVKIELDLPDDVYTGLVLVAQACSVADQQREGATTHGALDARALLAMLAEDAAMTHSRPGSWEGANMLQVLTSHGYSLS